MLVALTENQVYVTDPCVLLHALPKFKFLYIYMHVFSPPRLLYGNMYTNNIFR
jgi:hypothetical protein